MTAVAVATPLGMALVAVCWPQIRALGDLRFRVVEAPHKPESKSDPGDVPVRALVLARPDGYDWFICKLPSKDSE